ncbi:MAG: hypothetical protein R2763_03430 [Mycobacterium sp.]
MNLVEEIIDWLYTEQLRVDEQWSYLLPTGFSWWADQYAQTVEMVREEKGPAGETGYLLCVRTELLRDLDLTDAALAEINGLPMRCASLSGPVYDAEARRLDLWSLIRLTDDNGGWIRFLVAAAAITQLAEARVLAPVLADAVGAAPATSDHPESGRRSAPDEMAFAAAVFANSGDQPCAWSEAEFRETVAEYMNRPPARAGTAGPTGFTVEFPFGKQNSLCRVSGDQPHPLYGNGLLVLQRFPVPVESETEGIKLALSLNAADLTHRMTGYGLGSYVYADGTIHFTAFIPNALHKPGLLANLYLSCAARAQAMESRFAEGDWDPDAYSLDPDVLARRRRQRQATAPAVERPMRGCPMARAQSGGG